MATGFATNLALANKEANQCYELRVYTAAEGKLEALNSRFRDHTCKLFEKHGMTNVGYWTPVENPQRKLYYILSYPDREARTKGWNGFIRDPEWQAAYKESEKEGRLAAKVESHIMHTSDLSPAIKISKPKAQRLFELRTYTATEGNLERLKKRFRDHTMRLMKKHGIAHYGYWELDSDNKDAKSTLIYIITHKSEEARTKSLNGFREDAAWKKAKEESEKEAGGALTTPDGVKSVLMVATDYSKTR